MMMLLWMVFAAQSALATEPANPTEELLDARPARSEIRPSHLTRGLISLPLLGYQIGSGLALRSQAPAPDLFLRQTHMIANLGLLGLALYDLDDVLQLKQTRPQSKVHRLLGYSYLGTVLLSAVAGLVQVRALGDDRSASSVKTWNSIHTGLGVAAAASLLGSAFTVRFD